MINGVRVSSASNAEVKNLRILTVNVGMAIKNGKPLGHGRNGVNATRISPIYLRKTVCTWEQYLEKISDKRWLTSIKIH